VPWQLQRETFWRSLFRERDVLLLGDSCGHMNVGETGGEPNNIVPMLLLLFRGENREGVVSDNEPAVGEELTLATAEHERLRWRMGFVEVVGETIGWMFVVLFIVV